MKSAYRNLQIRLEVNTLGCCERITSISPTIQPPLISHRNHVIGIQTFNVRAGFRHPISYDRRRTTIASSFVRQLPSEDSRTRDISTDNSFDVRLVLRLNFRIGVPRCFGSIEIGVVNRHSAIIAPVVDKVDDEFDPVRFGTFNNIVESLETVCTGIDDWLFAGDEALEPNAAGSLRYIVES